MAAWTWPLSLGLEDTKRLKSSGRKFFEKAATQFQQTDPSAARYFKWAAKRFWSNLNPMDDFASFYYTPVLAYAEELLQAAARGTLTRDLAAEGGMDSALWAGRRRQGEASAAAGDGSPEIPGSPDQPAPCCGLPGMPGGMGDDCAVSRCCRLCGWRLF